MFVVVRYGPGCITQFVELFYTTCIVFNLSPGVFWVLIRHLSVIVVTIFKTPRGLKTCPQFSILNICTSFLLIFGTHGQENPEN